MSIDKGNFSPYYAIGMIHAAYAVAYPPRGGSQYHQPYAHMWTYRRGFARAYRLARGLQPIPRVQKPREHDRSSGRMCWCWNTHAPVNRANSFQAGQQQLAAKLADPDRTDWNEAPR